MYLAKKKLEIEARAAASIQPTQARVLCNHPSNDVTSARSKLNADPGGKSENQTQYNDTDRGGEK